MARIAWDKATDRFYDAGLDRGVLYPKTKSAVPWNGLTSVGENGSEPAMAYYIDGRPYLYQPKPKEFEATVSAITYPDELSDLMGLVEVADGMYLDSQIGSSFDMSYRTLVGNAIDGETHGYKIHLVYNAVATPQEIDYRTLSDSTAPSEFQFLVQALPVPIPGFRDTAHIVIDTRHMEPDNIRQIESLLYGSDTDDITIDGGTPSDPGTDSLDGGYLDGVLTEQMDGGSPSDVGFGTLDGGSPSTPGLDVVDGGTSDDPRTEDTSGAMNLLVADGGGPEAAVSNVTSLPNPQIIFDILNFVNGIIITDLGNGLWTAEGTYSDVYLTTPGYFQIDNVNATTANDGTYTITTTTV